MVAETPDENDMVKNLSEKFEQSFLENMNTSLNLFFGDNLKVAREGDYFIVRDSNGQCALTGIYSDEKVCVAWCYFIAAILSNEGTRHVVHVDDQFKHLSKNMLQNCAYLWVSGMNSARISQFFALGKIRYFVKILIENISPDDGVLPDPTNYAVFDIPRRITCSQVSVWYDRSVVILLARLEIMYNCAYVSRTSLIPVGVWLALANATRCVWETFLEAGIRFPDDFKREFLDGKYSILNKYSHGGPRDATFGKEDLNEVLKICRLVLQGLELARHTHQFWIEKKKPK